MPRQRIRLIRSYRSEREDWILTMVAAGMGVCFLPEFGTPFPAWWAGPSWSARSPAMCAW